ncbi:hypothetical protein EIP91_010169 [Steccherinum ochraceum]|uniref:Transmembrane protein n=1 Tax=Steccherinum ochraceum TaxID=92696 RepID=A0A4R0RV38_9APHY|nr:hypothetical protein EIP91_010169 [Steccherinum ochraceum]
MITSTQAYGGDILFRPVPPMTFPEARPIRPGAFTASPFESATTTVYSYTPAEMPKHWDCRFDVQEPFATVFEVLFRGLCLAALGRIDLRPAWAEAQDPNLQVWHTQKDRLSQRVQVMTTIVSCLDHLPLKLYVHSWGIAASLSQAGLLLSTAAAFVTTQPPSPGSLDYTQHGPYVCLLLAFALILGALVVGCAVVYAMGQCTVEWWTDILMSSRSRVCCTLFLIAYPFLCICVSITVLSFGLLSAAWQSESGLIRQGSTFVFLIPVLLLPIFLYTQAVVLWGQARTWMAKRMPYQRESREDEEPVPAVEEGNGSSYHAMLDAPHEGVPHRRNLSPRAQTGEL